MAANPVFLMPLPDAQPSPTLVPIPAAATAATARGGAMRSAVRFRDYLQRHALANRAQLARALGAVAADAQAAEGSPVRLGDLLISEGLVGSGEIARMLELQRQDPGIRLGQLLVQQGVVEAQTIRHVLAQHLGIPAVDILHFERDPTATMAIPPAVCRRHRILPICFIDQNLIVALADPTDQKVRDAVRFATRIPVRFVVATAIDLATALERCFGDTSELDAAAMAAGDPNPGSGDDAALIDMRDSGNDEERPMIRLVNSIIQQAIQRKASDIHIRPAARGVQLALRIDGTMVQVRVLSRRLLAPLVARIKVMTRLDISQRFLPQDGSARFADGNRLVDLRVSVIPTINGESVVIRILDSQAALRSLDQLGFAPEALASLRGMLSRNSGLVLVTGPTGAGKTTTLYAALREVLARKVTVMSVEDPVEYHMEGVNQIAVNHDVGLNFAKALRHILRHDPDALMVGEIRDPETAEIALESAMTGHLVLSTLHTGSAAGAIPRLIDMGVPAYLVASTISGIVAQRLVRLNCSHCLVAEEVSPEIRNALGLSTEERFARGFGCDRCGDTGFVGREVVYELLEMTPTMRRAVQGNATGQELQLLAEQGGMQPLTKRVVQLARERRTSLAEAFRLSIN